MRISPRKHLTLVGWLVLALLLLAGCGGGGKKAAPPVAKKPGCTKVSAPKLAANNQPKPTVLLDKSKTYDVTLETNCGSFTIRIDQAQSPNAAASFVTLVQRGFFNQTIFHRIVPGFVIQGGDPTGSGNGGPGYTTLDTPPATAAYTHGVVAMAKTATQPAGAAGSQFFVVTAGNAGLPADYAIIGKVTRGLNVVDLIGRHGNAASPTGAPTMVIEIEQASVKIT